MLILLIGNCGFWKFIDFVNDYMGVYSINYIMNYCFL